MAEKTVPESKEEKGELTPTREASRYLTPPVDIHETDEALVVTTDIPGVAKDALNIRVDDGILTIEARPTHEGNGSAVIEEFGLVNYFLQFELHDAVDQDKIEAGYRHGVLTVTLPKAEAAKPKQIAVTVG